MRPFLAALAIAVAIPAFAEITLPQASPGVTLSHDIGISKVTVTYHRPAVKGRKIWGDLVPEGKVWRLGANNATTLTLSHDATINGNKVPAGTYALFAIPSANEWTFIVNKDAKQWGAYFHKPEQDLLRFNVKPQANEATEWFDIDLVPVSDRALRVDVAWEKVRVPFTIEFDVPGLVWKQIDERLASKDANWEDFHQAARYAMATGQRGDDAMKWIDKAMETESFWNYELKARLLHERGRTAEALPLMAKAKELARGKAPDEYITGLERDIATWTAKP